MITSQFLQSAQSGDPEAIETLVRGHQRAVFQLALSVIDDGAGSGVSPQAMHQAEAATRETFIAAVDRLGSYREETPFDPWLYSIAVQVSRRRYRRWKLLRGLMRLIGRGDDSVPAIYANPADSSLPAANAALDAELWSKVRALPEALRLPVVLRYYHDMPIADIARVLRTSEGAVHARLDAARERITSEAG